MTEASLVAGIADAASGAAVAGGACLALAGLVRSGRRARRRRVALAALLRTACDPGAGDRRHVAVTALRQATDLLGADFAELLVLGRGANTGAALWGRHDGDWVETRGEACRLAGTYWSRAVAAGEPFAFDLADGRGATGAEPARSALRSMAVAPLRAGGELHGALRVGFARAGQARRALPLLQALASRVGPALREVTLLEEVTAERAMLARIVESSTEGICSLDAAGRVLSWNRAMELATGVPAQDAVGSPLEDALCTVAAAGARGSARRIFESAGRREHAAAIVAVHAAGTDPAQRRWLSLSISRVAGPRDAPVFAVCTARDVTATHEAELAKQDFVATVSHELRTPLTPIKGFLLTLLRDDVRVEPEQVRYFHRRMLEQAQRLERLIEDLLAVSQLERGTFRVEPVEVDLAALVDAVAADVPRPVDVAVPRPTVVVADASRVEQVLGNLLCNAHQYSVPGTPVRVGVERRASEVVVTVEDEGPGIPLRAQEAAFERFRRLGDPMTRCSGGAGLGLYLARRLVEAMGGRIWVESAPGAGSCFRFTLPRPSRPRDARAAPADRVGAAVR